MNRQVDPFTGGGDAYEWRIMPWRGAVLIVKELNEAIDAQEFAMIKTQLDGSALDFWFGERVFRVVFANRRPTERMVCRTPSRDSRRLARSFPARPRRRFHTGELSRRALTEV